MKTPKITETELRAINPADFRINPIEKLIISKYGGYLMRAINEHIGICHKYDYEQIMIYFVLVLRENHNYMISMEEIISHILAFNSIISLEVTLN